MAIGGKAAFLNVPRLVITIFEVPADDIDWERPHNPTSKPNDDRVVAVVKSSHGREGTSLRFSWHDTKNGRPRIQRLGEEPSLDADTLLAAWNRKLKGGGSASPVSKTRDCAGFIERFLAARGGEQPASVITAAAMAVPYAAHTVRYAREKLEEEGRLSHFSGPNPDPNCTHAVSWWRLTEPGDDGGGDDGSDTGSDDPAVPDQLPTEWEGATA